MVYDTKYPIGVLNIQSSQLYITKMIYHTEESLPAPAASEGVCLERSPSTCTFFGKKKDAMMMQGKKKMLLQAQELPNVKEISILSTISSFCAPLVHFSSLFRVLLLL